MKIRIKICGIKNLKDALLCVNEGVDALGFIFYQKSKRYISPQRAKDIIKKLPPFISKVGVFVERTPVQILKIAKSCNLDTVQLHSLQYSQKDIDYLRKYLKVIKVIKVKDKSSLKEINKFDTDAILLDTFSFNSEGGTGRAFNWEVLKNLRSKKPIIVSGGLKPHNIKRLFSYFVPWGLDVASGVESCVGKKDPKLVKSFMREVKKIEGILENASR